MIWLHILLAVAVIYLLIGLFIAILRISGHDMPWQLFVFTIIFWPTIWMN